MLLRSSWRFINRCPFVPFEQRLSIASRHAPVDRHNWSERLPILFRPSFWNTCYPNLSQYVRNRWSGKYKKKNVAKKKEWNPATFFFWMAIFIGSNSINLLLLKTEWDIFSRKADAKLAVLKEVIEKLQRGEEVDVEKALGTGDEIQEREWTEGKWRCQSATPPPSYAMCTH